MISNIPIYITPILERLASAGYEAYLVGGCVRDHAMGRIPNDYDVTTNATPDDMLRIFSDYRVIETGLKHGTLTVISEGEQVEITTYRIDGEYADNRHPTEVSFTDDITLDLSRRDFTVNAMAYSPTLGLCDPFDGMGDLERRIISCVGVPEERFREDGLRILRAVRFAAVLSFDISDATADAVHDLAPLLDGISKERIFTELSKLVCGVGASRIFRDFSDVLSRCVSGVSADTFKKCAGLMEKLPHDHVARLAFLFYMEDPENAEEVTATAMASLKSSTAESRRARALVRECAHPLPETDAEIRRLMSRMPETDIPVCASLYAAATGADGEGFLERYSRVAETDPCVRIKDLALNGRDVMTLTSRRGEAVGEALVKLLDLVMEGVLENTRESLTFALTSDEFSL